MSLFNRFQGAFFSPQPTFKALSEKPVWVDALIIIFIVTAVFSYLTAPYTSQDTYKAMKDNVKLQEKMGKERFEAAIKDLENPTEMSRIRSSLLYIPVPLVLGLLISSLFLLIIGRIVSTEGTFIAVFTALLHANFIDKILGNAVRLVLILMRKSAIQTTTSLALLVPNADFTSNTFILLSQFDFFQLWMFAVIGYGLSFIFKISVKKALVISYSFWVLKSCFNLAIIFLFRSFMG
jgi:hypothetical protein